ncbi:hypothetical protein HNR23_000585 [Nocardiopsis mwathae]|uniref:Uncharacterized protein n=1 Tax=Nocardiopsis mwathae TaxID=1472723 RepID=A0A7X0D3Z2_9ACTN|nr:hypothetical protein [Nocardiopsis mwathae]MBB6170525.1 hypothetical protein [Nocardiopsis mwathae]
MSGDEVGANVGAALGKGRDLVITANGLRGLTIVFNQAIDEANTAVGKTPGVSGYDSFGGEYESFMSEVESHALGGAYNVQDAASGVGSTDSANDNSFSASGAGLSRRINW